MPNRKDERYILSLAILFVAVVLATVWIAACSVPTEDERESKPTSAPVVPVNPIITDTPVARPTPTVYPTRTPEPTLIPTQVIGAPTPTPLPPPPPTPGPTPTFAYAPTPTPSPTPTPYPTRLPAPVETLTVICTDRVPIEITCFDRLHVVRNIRFDEDYATPSRYHNISIGIGDIIVYYRGALLGANQVVEIDAVTVGGKKPKGYQILYVSALTGGFRASSWLNKEEVVGVVNSVDKNYYCNDHNITLFHDNKNEAPSHDIQYHPDYCAELVAAKIRKK